MTTTKPQPKVRVRFAPSPTGHLHVGNARTALLNWLFARQHNGRFVLRIDNADQEHSQPQFERAIVEDLRWLGLDWDEGPELGGPFAPYRQAERLAVYKEFAERLEGEQKAYRCYCTPEELAHEREEMLAKGLMPRYSGRCRHLTEKQRRAYEREGRRWVLRLRVDNGRTAFVDAIKGHVAVDHEVIGDFVILRSNGTPSPQFASVVDDALMQITHVIRSEDHLSQVPKEILLHKALGFRPPVFAHLPLIVGPDKTPLSLRQTIPPVQRLRQLGYLAEALVVFLYNISSRHSDERILSLNQLVEDIDLGEIANSPVVFNLERLRLVNAMFVRKLETDRLLQLAKPYLLSTKLPLPPDEKLARMLDLVRDRLETLADIAQELNIFLSEPRFSPEIMALLRKDSARKVLWSFLRQIRMLEHLDADSFRLIMKEAGNETGILGKELWTPVRAALTGQLQGPPLAEVAALLGKDLCEQRIAKVLGVS